MNCLNSRVDTRPHTRKAASLVHHPRAIRSGLRILLLQLVLGSPGLLAQGDDPTAPVPYPLLSPQATQDFHASRPDELIWQDDRLFDQLLQAIQELGGHGLNPDDYHLGALQSLRLDRTARDPIATDAWFTAAAHMAHGKLDPLSLAPRWDAGPHGSGLAGRLQAALAGDTLATSLAELAPAQPEYQALREEYRRLQQQPEPPVRAVPDGPILRAGIRGDRVRDLQQRLAQLALLPPGYQTGLMDATTIAAVRSFQADRDLEPDGLVGPQTLAALNLDQAGRLATLRVNMERWRWLPEDLGRRHIRINIASFSLTTWEDHAPLRTHLVIVGRTYRRTPLFSDEIEYLIFNPWWEVPDSIALRDKLPEFRQEPGLVREQGFQVVDSAGQVVDPDSIDWNRLAPGNFPFRLRQEPGAGNALGRVKIMFPNVHNVYLHDTPAQELFEERQRAFSSGCIRAQYPLELSLWLLAETPGWDLARIDAILTSGEETRVNLTRRVPVHILYLTAVSGVDNGVRYLTDIYQRDAGVLAGLLQSHH